MSKCERCSRLVNAYKLRLLGGSIKGWSLSQYASLAGGLCEKDTQNGTSVWHSLMPILLAFMVTRPFLVHLEVHSHSGHSLLHPPQNLLIPDIKAYYSSKKLRKARIGLHMFLDRHWVVFRVHGSEPMGIHSVRFINSGSSNAVSSMSVEVSNDPRLVDQSMRTKLMRKEDSDLGSSKHNGDDSPWVHSVIHTMNVPKGMPPELVNRRVDFQCERGRHFEYIFVYFNENWNMDIDSSFVMYHLSFLVF